MKYLFILLFFIIACSSDSTTQPKNIEYSRKVCGQEAWVSGTVSYIQGTVFSLSVEKDGIVYVKGNFDVFKAVRIENDIFIKQENLLFQADLTQYLYSDSSFIYLYEFNIPLSETDTLKAWSLEESIF